MDKGKGITKPAARQKKNPASLYDVVAGRVGYEGFLTEPQQSKYRDLASTSGVPVPPEELLFRRVGAPVRYAEDDVYEADRHLTDEQRLPDSDLLKTIHAYAADFYGGKIGDRAAESFKSMDETALLAMGILLEEAAAGSLGETGDLAFVEAEELPTADDYDKAMYWHEGKWKRRVIEHDPSAWNRVLGHTRNRSAPRNKKNVRVRKNSAGAG